MHEVCKSNRNMFLMGKVSELLRKAMVINYRVFNLSNCSVIFKM